MKPGSVTVGAAVPSDLPWLVALNQAGVPAVDALDLAGMERIVAIAAATRIACCSGKRAGALVAFLPGADYASTNYRWFCRERTSFLYIDRVLVASRARRRGIGRALYEDALAQARKAGAGRLGSEVNEDPPNPVSLAFHERLGFTRILSRRDERSGKLVAMLECPVPRDDGAEAAARN